MCVPRHAQGKMGDRVQTTRPGSDKPGGGAGGKAGAAKKQKRDAAAADLEAVAARRGKRSAGGVSVLDIEQVGGRAGGGGAWGLAWRGVGVVCAYGVDERNAGGGGRRPQGPGKGGKTIQRDQGGEGKGRGQGLR